MLYEVITIGRDALLDDSIAGVERGLKEDVLRADHLIHLRCEVVGATVVDLAGPHMNNPLVKLVSLMDHTPGQRQWSEISHWLRYNKTEHLPKTEVESRLAKLREARALYGEAHRQAIVAMARAHGLVIATRITSYNVCYTKLLR